VADKVKDFLGRLGFTITYDSGFCVRIYDKKNVTLTPKTIDIERTTHVHKETFHGASGVIVMPAGQG
jgi:hypothetical protein